MQSSKAQILLLVLLVANIVYAGERTPSKVSAPIKKEMSLTEVEGRPNFDSYPIILDNSKFDLKQLLKPDVKKSETQRVFGPGSGGGGNICGLGIQQVTADLLRYFQEIPDGKKAAYIEPLRQAISDVRFLEGAGLMLRGQKVNAINYPKDKVIILDEQACRVLGEDSTRGKIFLLHEYLGLAGVEDTNYQLSSAIVNDLVRIRASEKRGGNFLVIPQTSVGRFALAWGMAGQVLDGERYAWDTDYRNWVETQFIVGYLVDVETGRILSAFYQNQDLPILSSRWNAVLVSDGNAGLLVLQSDRWTVEIAAAYFAYEDSGKIYQIPSAAIVKLNSDLHEAGVAYASSSRKKDIPQMSISLDETKIQKEDGKIKLPMTYYVPKSADNYELEVWVAIQFNYSNHMEIGVTGTTKINESWGEDNEGWKK